MDNNINFSAEQINALLSILNSDSQKEEKPDEKTVRDFIGKNLSQNQTDVLKKALENPEIINTILSSPKAKKLFEKYSGKEDKE